jgi:hypothetical protein
MPIQFPRPSTLDTTCPNCNQTFFMQSSIFPHRANCNCGAICLRRSATTNTWDTSHSDPYRRDEPGPECTYRQYCDYLTQIRHFHNRDELSPAQLNRLLSLEEADRLHRSNNPWIAPAPTGRAAQPQNSSPTKDEPDQ